VAGDNYTHQSHNQSIDPLPLPPQRKRHPQKIFCYSMVLNLWTRNEDKDLHEHL